MNLHSILLKNTAKSSILFFLLLLQSLYGHSEGSGTWGVTGNNQANLMIPTTFSNGGGNTGYLTRGYMLLPSGTNNYNPAHRLYVWVKSGETVYWGFHQETVSGGGNLTFGWYYDNSSAGTGYFPSATSSGTGRNLISSQRFNPQTDGRGVPASATRADAGPVELGNANGYSAHSFTNTTQHDRAFWLEVSGLPDGTDNQTQNREFNYWDITVASGSDVRPGRVYCKYWSLWNSLPNVSGTSNSGRDSFPASFGFHIPVDNRNTPENDFFVKRADFSGSNAGYVIFFANSQGPGRPNDPVEERRRSITRATSEPEYPLFLNDPDVSVWPSAVTPDWSISATFSKKTFPAQGGQGKFTVTAHTPGVVDIFLDLNNNGSYDVNTDILLSHEFTTIGSHVFDWDGKFKNGTDVPANTPIKVVSSMAFFPVHFPIYDMEQSLGIKITHRRPGTPYDDVLYWDDTHITGSLSAGDPKVNTTGLPGRVHRWYATGNSGYSNNNTINTWTGAFNKRSEFAFIFRYDSEVDLAVIKKVSKGAGELKDIETAGAGELVTFTITAKNLAISGQQEVTATGVNVRDILPTGYEFVSTSLPPNEWDPLNHDWIIGSLSVGEERTMTITAKVLATGEYRNEAIIRGNESEKDDTNNKDDATLQTFDVEGNVFHDPDAGNVNISTTNAINSIPNGIYASLVSSDGKVVNSILVATGTPSAGSFIFKTIPGGNYTVVVGNSFLTPGQPVPSTPPLALPVDWIHVGNYNGAPNTGSTNRVDGKSDPFEVDDETVYNINFSIQMPPKTGNSHYSLVEDPDSGDELPLDGTVDAKDNRKVGEIIASDTDGQLTTLIITRLAEPILPSGGRTSGTLDAAPVLYYGNQPVVLDQPIVGFDPAELFVKLLGKGYVGFSFDFKVIDDGVATSNTSTYTVDWINMLPVTWVSVDVKEEQNQSVVTWSTAEEKNVSAFEVQYSTNASNWEIVGMETPQNLPMARYQFVHKPAKSAIHYYRIKSIDFDGTSSLSQIVSRSSSDVAGMILYPNPVVSGLLQIETDLSSATQLKVFTITGVEVMRGSVKSNAIDVSNLVSGTYILQVNHADGSTKSRTFVVR